MRYPDLYPEIVPENPLHSIRQYILKTCTYPQTTVYLKKIYDSRIHGDESTFETSVFNLDLWKQLVERDFPYNYQACLCNAPHNETLDTSRMYWESTYKTLLNEIYGKLSPDSKRLALYITSGNFAAIKEGFQDNYQNAGFASKLKLSDLFIKDEGIIDKSMGMGFKQPINAIQLCLKKGHNEYLAFFFELAQLKLKENTLNIDLEIYAATFGQLEAFWKQINNHPNLTEYLQKSGMRLLNIAAYYNHYSIAHFMLANYCEALRASTTHSPLYSAAEGGHECMVSLLIEYGFSLNYQAIGKPNPLYIAALNNHVNVLKILLGKGADPNLVSQINNNKHTNPLRIACEFRHHEIVDVLLKYNANPNQIFPDNKITPLFIAVQEGDVDLLQLFIQHKATRIDQEDKYQETPLFIAIRNNNLPIVKLLLESGANASHPNSASFKPLNIARGRNHIEISDFLAKFIHFEQFINPYSSNNQAIKRMFCDYSGYNFANNPTIAKANRVIKGHGNASYGNEVFELLCKAEYKISFDYNVLLKFIYDLQEKLSNKEIKPQGTLSAIFSHMKYLTKLDYYHTPQSPEEIFYEPQQYPPENKSYPDLIYLETTNYYMENQTMPYPPSATPPAPPNSPREDEEVIDRMRKLAINPYSIFASPSARSPESTEFITITPPNY